MLLASAIVPVTFITFCWEQNALADMPLPVVALAYLGGGVIGLLIASILEPILVVSSATGGLSLPAAFMVGLIEEFAKVVPVLFFLRDRRLRTELDGVILGAASGMGFATFETAGYGFDNFLTGFLHTLAQSSPVTVQTAFNNGIAAMNGALILRMALALFGHGVWTAIVCAAIWRYRQAPLTQQLGNIAIAFFTSVILHMLWDGVPVIGWVFDAVVGLALLRFFIWESLERAKLGPMAPPPPPLWVAVPNAFRGYFARFGHRQQPAYGYAVQGYAAPGMPGYAGYGVQGYNAQGYGVPVPAQGYTPPAPVPQAAPIYGAPGYGAPGYTGGYTPPAPTPGYGAPVGVQQAPMAPPNYAPQPSAPQPSAPQPLGQPAPQGPTCPTCGSVNQPGAYACQNCGTRLM
jgi:RsiW-degrading membrane proteinase PrsW (M82 family)